MQYRDGSLIFAPTDLSRWLSSPYASWMSRYATELPDEAPSKDEPDAMLKRLAVRGIDHEDALEKEFRDSGLTVVNVAENSGVNSGLSLSEKHQVAVRYTSQLMSDGVDVIAQALLQKESFRGYADFLVKVPGASELGDYHYEVWDTKLARRVKPGMILQLCCYVDMVDSIQGRKAEHLVVALGNGEKQRVPLVDCFDYYLSVKRAFLEAQDNWSIGAEPDPAAHSEFGDWAGYASKKLEARDHLSRVARISRREIDRLEADGITTKNGLVGSASCFAVR